MSKKLIYHRPGKKPKPEELNKDEEAVELTDADFMKYKVLSELVSELKKARRQ